MLGQRMFFNCIQQLFETAASSSSLREHTYLRTFSIMSPKSESTMSEKGLSFASSTNLWM